jgi:hypothetical protein
MPTLNRLVATIGAGQPVSNLVDAAADYICGLIMPEAWTAAHVTIEASLDSTFFYGLFTCNPDDSTIVSELKFNVVPNEMIAIDPHVMLMARYFRIRSGTRDEPISQEANRIFGIITVNSLN